MPDVPNLDDLGHVRRLGQTCGWNLAPEIVDHGRVGALDSAVLSACAAHRHQRAARCRERVEQDQRHRARGWCVVDVVRHERQPPIGAEFLRWFSHEQHCGRGCSQLACLGDDVTQCLLIVRHHLRASHAMRGGTPHAMSGEICMQSGGVIRMHSPQGDTPATTWVRDVPVIIWL